jgi:HD superfamily phosphohydrolase
MYWQVYLHRTAVGYEKTLINTLLRVKDLVHSGKELFATPALTYFLKNYVTAEWFSTHAEALQMYADLDDSDIWSAMKAWKHSDFFILSTLATDMLDRKIFKVEIHDTPISDERIEELQTMIAEKMGITYQGYVKKESGKSEFIASEIKVIKDILHLTNKEVAEIFLS